MKKQLCLLLLASLLLFATASKVLAAEKYHGEFCWQVFSNVGEPWWLYKFGVYEKEGGHLTLFGSVDYGANGISAAHGNAIIVGNNVKLTIVSSDYEDGDGEVWSETFTAVLSTSTFNGEWNALSLQSTDNVNVIPVVQKGTIDLIDCS
jgi:hypothetical protein